MSAWRRSMFLTRKIPERASPAYRLPPEEAAAAVEAVAAVEAAALEAVEPVVAEAVEAVVVEAAEAAALGAAGAAAAEAALAAAAPGVRHGEVASRARSEHAPQL